MRIDSPSAKASFTSNFRASNSIFLWAGWSRLGFETGLFKKDGSAGRTQDLPDSLDDGPVHERLLHQFKETQTDGLFPVLPGLFTR